MFLSLSSSFMLLPLVSIAFGATDHTSKNEKNTLLDDQFCQAYYTLPDDDDSNTSSMSNCATLRSSIRSEIRGNGTPTLELGNPETQPAMVLLHGWPDTAAIWANQFAEFCGEDHDYFCVAPSWMDFHPDVPAADPSTLFWSNQRDAFHAVIEDLGLSEITFVIFDFGCMIGYQMLYLYPDLFSKVIAMDIPLKNGAPVTLPEITQLAPYQQNNINAFLSNNDTMLMDNVQGMNSPCQDCRIAPNATGIGAKTGWPYYNLVRDDSPWMSDGFEVSPEDWEYTYVPSFPDEIPLLYLWASEAFQAPTWFDFIDTRAKRSEHLQVMGSSHWIMVNQPETVNAKIMEWLSSNNKHTMIMDDDGGSSITKDNSEDDITDKSGEL